MSLYDYKKGQELDVYCVENRSPFYSILQCLMRKADSNNEEKLKNSFPAIWEELFQRYNAPGGRLEGD